MIKNRGVLWFRAIRIHSGYLDPLSGYVVRVFADCSPRYCRGGLLIVDLIDIRYQFIEPALSIFAQFVEGRRSQQPGIAYSHAGLETTKEFLRGCSLTANQP
ncbi:hypothetical protein L2E82_11544 [Cichorium intybus]|uniref:Uncharacterized protein n=1 Tax=Cichorium intybus TaxID=13427 RepID=A0ACB9GFJ0_CICIN|nr:hypothetical protein L2E82_11544 [Cichorium intybus]